MLDRDRSLFYVSTSASVCWPGNTALSLGPTALQGIKSSLSFQGCFHFHIWSQQLQRNWNMEVLIRNIRNCTVFYFANNADFTVHLKDDVAPFCSQWSLIKYKCIWYHFISDHKDELSDYHASAHSSGLLRSSCVAVTLTMQPRHGLVVFLSSSCRNLITLEKGGDSMERLFTICFSEKWS